MTTWLEIDKDEQLVMSEEEKKQEVKEKKSFSKGGLLEKSVPVLLILIAVLAFVVGVLWQKVANLEKGKSANTQVAGEEVAAPEEGKLTPEQAEKIPPVSDQDHIIGSKDAEVIVIEYSDFECPFCKNFHQTMHEVVDQYQGQVAWVYRHFPLDFLHEQARPEAYASECVAELGGNEAFWTFADLIYEKTTSNDGLDLDLLPDFAVQAGVDQTEFQNCLDSEKHKDLVDQQYNGGSEAGVNGTPGNLIINKSGDAWLVPGALPLESLKQVIDQALGN